MHVDLALRAGVLHVVDSSPSAELVLFDLDGRRLRGGFALDVFGPDAPRVGGVAVDEDRRIWLADTLGGRVCAASQFGRSVETPGALGRADGGQAGEHDERGDVDRAGALGRPRALDAQGPAEDLRLLVGSEGARRHGLQVFDGEGALIRSLRPRGESHGRFTGVEGVHLDGRFALACEPRRGWVQVYRDLEFHALIELPRGFGEELRPQAARRLEDGRYVVAFGGDRSGVVLLSRDGRPLLELAGSGAEEGQVLHPSSLVVEPGRTDALTRVVVADRDGERVQVLTLDGRTLGELPVHDPATFDD